MSRVGIKLQRQESDDAATCDITRRSTHWMPNSDGLDPCGLVDQAVHTCSESSPPVGRVQDDLKCPGDPKSACCCSIATYALLSACWVCQGHSHKDIESQITTSYESFLRQCNGSYYHGAAPDMLNLKLPAWTEIQPTDWSEKWDFDKAQANASFPSTSSNIESASTSGYVQTFTAFGSPMTSTPSTSIPSVSASTKSSVPTGTIAASVLGALAAMALFCVGGCFFWRWRRRQRVIQAAQGTKVDLTEPEVHETSPPLRTQQRSATFPYPFEGVVPRYHANAQHSYNPTSHSDEPEAARPLPPLPPEATPATSGRRFTAPSGDQLMRDLARLGESPRQKSKSPWRRRASISTFTYSDSGSSGSRRAPRQSDGQGQYFHLPPSAQYLAEVARYPENVDPDRPWNVRR